MSTSSVASFADLGLAEAVVRAVRDTGYEAPSPIQAAAIPPLLAGRDLLGQAQTGTGKTAAFALPLLSRLDLTRRQPQLLVLTPTRELAIQVAEAMQTYARYLPGFHVLPVYGGQGMDTQLRQLKRGVHAVVGTPGRVADHLRRGTLRLDGLAAVVLDEADEMLRMGFIEEVTGILEQTPADKQVALFSATMPAAISRIARSHLREPAEVRIAAKTATVDTVSQLYWEVSAPHKLDALTRILEVEDFDAMLVFVRTRNATVELAERLEARGYASAALNGDMPQAARERTVERLKSGAIDILVATDVAARGLDVDRISHVLNYDVPHDTEAYVHRIGRTGRAGRSGSAVLFVAPRERRMLRAIEHATGQPILHMRLPSSEDISDRRTARFKQLITDTLAGQDLTYLSKVIADYQAEHNVSADDIAAALAWQLQRDKPLRPAAAKTSPAAGRRERPAASAASVTPTGAGAPPPRPPKPRPERKTKPPREHSPAIVEEPPGVAPPVTPGPDVATADTAPASAAAEPAPGEQAPEAGRPRRHGVKPAPEALLRYRIAVGRAHGAEARHIVGAIANESGLDSEFIGRVRIEEEHSTVELPEGMPKIIFKHLKKVWVCGRQLNIEPDRSPGADMRPPRQQPAGDRPGLRSRERHGGTTRPSSAGFDKRGGGSRPAPRPPREAAGAAPSSAGAADGNRNWPKDPSRSGARGAASAEAPAAANRPDGPRHDAASRNGKPTGSGAGSGDRGSSSAPFRAVGAGPRKGGGKPASGGKSAASGRGAVTGAARKAAAPGGKPTLARKGVAGAKSKPAGSKGKPKVTRKSGAKKYRPPKPG